MSKTGDLISMGRFILVPYWVCGAVLMMSHAVTAQPVFDVEHLQQAQSCTVISDRLARLSCFDHVFKTPLHNVISVTSNVEPFSWRQAMDSFNATQSGEKTHLNLQRKGDRSNAWLTIGAKNGRRKFPQGRIPVLKMSCIDKISRIEIAMPKEIKEARVRLSLVAGDSRYWRTDDSGLLLTTGRGIPAINQMKRMMREQSVTLRSNDKSIDGLVFETDTLNEALKPLRKRCDW